MEAMEAMGVEATVMEEVMEVGSYGEFVTSSVKMINASILNNIELITKSLNNLS